MKNKKFNILVLILAILIIFTGCVSNNSDIDTESNPPIAEDQQNQQEQQEQQTETAIDDNGIYTDPYLVAEYIHTYNKLPANYLTKNEAKELGWESDKGNLWEVTDEMSIGGDKFGNREGLLPKKDGRIYYECDVNYEGGYRGTERIVFSNDGLIFYTDDHYESFTQLY
jgi:guanyl-specific ribonuclease Sa